MQKYKNQANRNNYRLAYEPFFCFVIRTGFESSVTKPAGSLSVGKLAINGREGFRRGGKLLPTGCLKDETAARCSPLQGSTITAFQTAPRPVAMATCYHSPLSLFVSVPGQLPFYFSLSPRVLLPHDNTEQTFRFSLSMLSPKLTRAERRSSNGCESPILFQSFSEQNSARFVSFFF